MFAAIPQQSPSVFDREIFLFSQRHFTIGEKYNVADEAGNSILFIERPAHLMRNLGAGIAGAIFGLVIMGSVGFSSGMLPDHHALRIPLIFLGIFGGIIGGLAMGVALSQKRHVTIYADDSKSIPLVKVRQDQKIYFITSTFSVTDADGSPLAKFQKNHLHDILRKQWTVFDASGAVLFVAREDSIARALLRRVLGPFFGLLRTNFIFITDGRTFGEFNRSFTLFDRYTLDMSADPARTIDRRIAVAMGVMLDTGERR